MALPGSTYSRKANARVQLKGIGWPPRVRDTAQSYLRLVHWALLEFMEPYGLKNTLCLLLHLLSPFVFRVSVPDNLVVGRTHTIVRLQTRIRRKHGTDNFGGFVYVLDGFLQRDFVLWVFMCSINFSVSFPATTPRATTPHLVSRFRLPRRGLPRPIYTPRAITPRAITPLLPL